MRRQAEEKEVAPTPIVVIEMVRRLYIPKIIPKSIDFLMVSLLSLDKKKKRNGRSERMRDEEPVEIEN